MQGQFYQIIQISFRSICTSVYSHQQGLRVPLFQMLVNLLYCQISKFLLILWHEPAFVHIQLTIHVSSSAKWLFMSLICFSMRSLSVLVICRITSCILEIRLFSIMCIENHSITLWLFTLPFSIFDKQKFLILISS